MHIFDNLLKFFPPAKPKAKNDDQLSRDAEGDDLPMVQGEDEEVQIDRENDAPDQGRDDDEIIKPLSPQCAEHQKHDE